MYHSYEMYESIPVSRKEGNLARLAGSFGSFPSTPNWKVFRCHEGLDFVGFGPHALRRANFTWRREIDSGIEVSKIAKDALIKHMQVYIIL